MTEFIQRTLLFFALSHVYLFWRWFVVFGKKPAFLLLLPWFAAMGLFPLLHMYFPAGETAQDAFALAGSVWQPFAFFCLTVFLPFDACRAGAWILRRIRPSLDCVPRLGSRPALVCIFLWGCVFAYGVYEARTLRVTNLEIPTSALPEGTDRLRLVFAADLHISPQTRLFSLPRAVDRILEQKPDCILLGGDILDDSFQGTPADQAQLARLKAPLGVFGVLGNHDAFGDVERAEDFIGQDGGGIQLLSSGMSASYSRSGPLLIIGAEDPLVVERTAGRKRVVFDPPWLVKDARENGPKPFCIVLDHRPRLWPKSIGFVDLQLSGHTHGGQIFVLEPLMRKEYGVPTGLSAHSSEQGETRLFVTTGVGFSKLPIRLFVPPEIVVIDLVRSSAP